MSEEVKSDITKVSTLEVGEIVKGQVIKVDPSQAFVDVGYKYDGILPISEVSSLHIAQISDVLSEGDQIEVKVLVLDEENQKLVLSKKAVDADRAWKELLQKYEAGETIQAQVADIVKGGLVVDLGVRGFIPASLVEIHYVEDFSDYKGKELTFKIIEIDPEKNKLILSRKAVLEEELRQQKLETLHSLEPGQIVEGKVQRITDFGAFVDIGGVDGLVHVSQLAWNRVEHPSDVLSEGDQIQVKVLSVNPETERISLSLKETQEGPWEQVAKQIQVGDIVTGTVRRIVSFGAFVEVYPGVEGLVHISQIAKRHIVTPAEVLEEGQEVKVKILNIQIDEKRISLSIREAEEAEEESNAAAETAEKNEESESGSGLNVTLGDVYPELRNLK